MTNIDIIKKGYELFAEGSVSEVLELFDSSIEWSECKGFPFVHGDGISVGPNAVVEDVFSQLPAHYEGFNIEIEELIGAADKVVMKGYYTGVWKPTGKEFRANATHVWTFREGKATHFFQAVDTAEIINA